MGGTSAAWDGRGNLTGEPQSAKTYGYSSENLLTSASGGVTLTYDPAMRLQQITGAATTKFAYDGLDTLAEYDGGDVLQRRFVFGPGQPAPAEAGEPIVQYDGGGTSNRSFLSSDERGSIVSLTDSAGTLLNINRYDEYGKPQSSNVGRFQYTGQMWLPEAGLYHYKARAYLPHLGIFAQTDPIGDAGSPNLYAYVLNDPVNLVDPLGLTKSVPCPGGGTAESPDKCTIFVRGVRLKKESEDPIVITGEQPEPAIVIMAALAPGRTAIGGKAKPQPKPQPKLPTPPPFDWCGWGDSAQWVGESAGAAAPVVFVVGAATGPGEAIAGPVAAGIAAAGGLFYIGGAVIRRAARCG